MQPYRIRWIRLLLLCGAANSMINHPCGLQAAEVPPGVQLAALQQLIITNGAEIATVDPHKTHGTPAGNVMRNVFEGLVNLNREGQVVPGVAQRWQQSPEGKTWTFYLRPNAKWSNGDPITAQDFVYSWRRLADPATRSPYASYLVNMRLANSAEVIAGKQPLEALGIQALDDHTLQLQLSQPVAYLVKMLAVCELYPLHAPTIARYGEGRDDHRWTAVSHFVGNGAYRIQEWVVNEKLVLTRNEHYWDNTHTVIESVTYLASEDEVVDMRRYQAAEVDITNTRLPLAHFQQLQQQYPQELRYFPVPGTYAYQLNLRRPPFNDRRVRQALSIVLDREKIVQQLLGQGEQVAYSLNPPNIEGFSLKRPVWADWPQAQRCQEARRLLKEAGYHTDNPLRFTLFYSTSELHEQIAVALASQWKHSLETVEITFACEEWKVFLQSRLSGHYQIARNGWEADYNEPSALLNNLLSNSGKNSGFYHSAVFDHWLEQALQATSDEACRNGYQQAEAQLAEDVPLIPLFHRVAHRLVKPYVGGLSDRNPMGLFYVKDLYLMQHPQAPSRYRQ